MLEYVYFNLVQGDVKRINSQSALRGRSRSAMLSIAVRKATHDFTDFSIADTIPSTPASEPRYYQVYIRVTQEEKDVIAQEAEKRHRSSASLVYTIARLVTADFGDFSIVDNGNNKEVLEHELSSTG